MVGLDRSFFTVVLGLNSSWLSVVFSVDSHHAIETTQQTTLAIHDLFPSHWTV
jgi:hypothetical protein